MKPLAILSCDTNPDYLFCLPIVAKSWELQGFDVLPMVIRDKDEVFPLNFFDMYLGQKLRTFSNTTFVGCTNPKVYVQCARMYVTRTRPSSQYCIIGDADMMIGSSFLHRDFDKVNVFGHDLTGFQEIPMCYVGMTAEKWHEVLGACDIETDLATHTKYKSEVWHEAWGADQQILTAKLKAYGFDKINFINRGTDFRNHNLPMGRWDRYGGFKRPTGQVHDVHLPRKPYEIVNTSMIGAVCDDLYPHVDWNWMMDYRNQFLKQFDV